MSEEDPEAPVRQSCFLFYFLKKAWIYSQSQNVPIFKKSSGRDFSIVLSPLFPYPLDGEPFIETSLAGVT